MECVLRVHGVDFDVNRFLEESPWRPNPVYHRGEERPFRGRGTELEKHSGFVVGVAGADDTWNDDFAAQTAAVLSFLRENHLECARLASFPGIDGRTLDFAVPLLDGEPMRAHHLPVALVQAAAEVGMALEVTVYAVAAEAE